MLLLARRTWPGHACQEVSSARVVGKQCSRQETFLGFLVLCIMAGILDSQSCRSGFPFCLPVSLSLSLVFLLFFLISFLGSWLYIYFSLVHIFPKTKPSSLCKRQPLVSRDRDMPQTSRRHKANHFVSGYSVFLKRLAQSSHKTL